MYKGKRRPALRRSRLWRRSYLSAGVATRSQKGLEDEETHLRQPCQEPLDFILAWPRKILWNRTRGPRALWSAVNQLQPSDCQSGAVTRQRPTEPSGRGLPAWSPVFRARNDSNFTNSKGLPGRVTMSTGEGFLPLVAVSSFPPPPSLLWQRLWTVCSLWGNLNSLATS